MSKKLGKEADEVTVLTSEKANSLMAMISDDNDVMRTWLEVMAQLRPTKERKHPVDIHPDDRVHAEEMVGLGLLERSPDDVDAYLVPRSIAYADYASNAFYKELN